MTPTLPTKPSFEELYSVPDAQMQSKLESSKGVAIALLVGMILVAGIAMHYATSYKSLKRKLKIQE